LYKDVLIISFFFLSMYGYLLYKDVLIISFFFLSPQKMKE